MARRRCCNFPGVKVVIHGWQDVDVVISLIKVVIYVVISLVKVVIYVVISLIKVVIYEWQNQHRVPYHITTLIYKPTSCTVSHHNTNIQTNIVYRITSQH